MNKIIITITLFGLLITLLVGCAKGVSTSSALTPLENNSTSTTSTTVISGDDSTSSPDILQSGLPLTVTQPGDAATINGDSVIVQGNTAPGATVSINNGVVTADSTGAFNATINLADGLNAIDVIATDNNNNQGEVLLMINAVPASSTPTSTTSDIFPGTLPLTVISPADSATLSTNTITVQGQTSPGATVTVDDQTDLADANGNFSINISLSNGPNAIDVVATDDNGDTSEVLLVVNVAGGS